MIKVGSYYQLAKPGIIYGNLLTAIAGYLMASHLSIVWSSFIGTVIGYSFVVGSACVFNNLYDRDIDKLMNRTSKRPSVEGSISLYAGLTFGTLILIIGLISLVLFTTLLSFMIACIGFIIYIPIYTYLKRKTHLATIVGALSGAMPILGGYLAYSANFTVGSLLIFLMMFFWQMPHFYAIAIFRLKDYQKAKVPVLPLVKTVHLTTYMMIVFSMLFFVTVVLLYINSSFSLLYLIILGFSSLIWLFINVLGLFVKEKFKWARQSFFVSLAVVLIMSLMIANR